MVVHSQTGWAGTGGRRSWQEVQEARLRRLMLRVRHLQALLRLNAVRGSGKIGKFPPDGNLKDGGKHGKTGSW